MRFLLSSKLSRHLFTHTHRQKHPSPYIFNRISPFSFRSSHSSSNMPNRLALEKSPYLLQHANNPVDWYPWGEEAFAKARAENKLIFLSVGYSTCHWCHVMEHESFEKQDVADVLNSNYVSIKVDREERPDVDRAYMLYVQATTGSGGWPMSVFLTPELHPVFGGTYFPKEDRYGRSGFITILKRISEAWEKDAERMRKSGANVVQQLQTITSSPEDTGKRILDGLKVAQQTFHKLSTMHDAVNGGTRGAPKFPTPPLYHFLLRYHALMRPPPETRSLDSLVSLPLPRLRAIASSVGVNMTGLVEKPDICQRIHEVSAQRSKDADHALEMVVHTLRKMYLGGIHDIIGHGFHRYSVDDHWHVPHFEKMLYDQGQLLSLYAEAYALTKDEMLRDAALDIVKYVRENLRDTNGGSAFFSAEDADSYPTHGAEHKLEGAFCAWTFDELTRYLGDEQANIFAYAYGVERKGNVPPETDIQGELQDQNVLFVAHTVEQTANHFNLVEAEVKRMLEECRIKLAEIRKERPPPHKDDKILTSWNGLMISGLIRAAEHLSDASMVEMAIQAAKFIHAKMYDASTGILLRSYRDGPSSIRGFSDDYSFLIRALIDLYEYTLNDEWVAWADRLQKTQIALFSDEEHGGFFAVPQGASNMILRLKDDHDGAEPSSNSVAAENLLRLHALLEDEDYKIAAEKLFANFSEAISQHPSSVPMMASALLLSQRGFKQIVITGDNETVQFKELETVMRGKFIPNRAIQYAKATGYLAKRSETVAAYAESAEYAEGPSVHICENMTCGMPLTSAKEFAASLGY